MSVMSGDSFFPAYRAAFACPAPFLYFFASSALKAALALCRKSRLKKPFSCASCKREVSNATSFLLNLLLSVKQGCDVGFIKILS